MALLIVLFLGSCQGFIYTGQVRKKDIPKNLRQELADYIRVPAGMFNTGVPGYFHHPDPVIHENRFLVAGFYLNKYEVSVSEYMNFCRISGDSSMKPDTLCFLRDGNDLMYNEPIASMYFWHPKFYNYPIVGITQKQAMAYLKWKSGELQNMLNDSTLLIYLRLPSEIEMEHYLKMEAEWIDKRLPFLNFNTGSMYSEKGEPIKFEEDDGFEYLAPVKHMNFKSSEVYQLFGNAAEMTQSSLGDFVFKHIDSAGWVSDHCLRQLKYSVPQSLSGNGMEWDTLCLDPPHARLIKDSTIHVSKGGSWFHDPYYCHPGTIIPYQSNKAYSWLRFRPVLVLERL